MRSLSIHCAAALCIMACVMPAHGGVVSQGLYRLHDQLDGITTATVFTLDADDLFRAAPDHDPLRLDLGHARPAAFFELDAAGIHFAEGAFGRREADLGYGLMRSSPLELDLADMMAASASGHLGVADAGSITWLGTGEVIPLWDKRSSESYWLRFADQDDNQRAGLAGWTWITHATFGQHVSSSDWLTAELTAPPGQAALGLGPFTGRRWQSR